MACLFPLVKLPDKCTLKMKKSINHLFYSTSIYFTSTLTSIIYLLYVYFDVNYILTLCLLWRLIIYILYVYCDVLLSIYSMSTLTSYYLFTLCLLWRLIIYILYVYFDVLLSIYYMSTLMSIIYILYVYFDVNYLFTLCLLWR